MQSPVSIQNKVIASVCVKQFSIAKIWFWGTGILGIDWEWNNGGDCTWMVNYCWWNAGHQKCEVQQITCTVSLSAGNLIMCNISGGLLLYTGVQDRWWEKYPKRESCGSHWVLTKRPCMNNLFIHLLLKAFAPFTLHLTTLVELEQCCGLYIFFL